MSFETALGLICFGAAIIGYLTYEKLSRINWAMLYYKMCGGK